jgi:hypothetical protein
MVNEWGSLLEGWKFQIDSAKSLALEIGFRREMIEFQRGSQFPSYLPLVSPVSLRIKFTLHLHLLEQSEERERVNDN